MGIFVKRPLAMILCIMTCGFIFFEIASDSLRALSLIIASSLIAVSFIPGFTRRPRLPLICLLLAFTLSFVYFDICFYPATDSDEEVEIIGVITDAERTDYGWRMDLRTDSVDGKGSPRRNIKVYLYNTDYEVKAGLIVKFKAKLGDFDSGGGFDFARYYTAEGFSATVDTAYIETVYHTDRAPFEYKINLMRRNICKSFADALGADEGGLLSALLLGEREEMADSLNLHFMRIGITHLLALSGMHLVILTAALERILKAIRVNRRARLVISCIFVLGFMCLTGFPSSICRAGAMLIISSIVYLLTGCKDNLTSLFVALAVILVVEPYAALDAGLWLSCLATLGIIVAAELLRDKPLSKNRLVSSFLTSMLLSLFAVSATIAVSAFLFDGFSYLSPLATYIFGFLTELYMYVGLPVFALSFVIPGITTVTTYLYSVTGELAEIFSTKIPYAYVSANSAVLKLGALALSTLLLIFFIGVFKRKRAFTLAILILHTFCAFFSVGAYALSERVDKEVFYAEEADVIIIRKNGVKVAFDTADGTGLDAYKTVNAVFDEGITELDSYVVTSYDASTAKSLEILLSRIKIDKLLLPLPMSYSESLVCESIFEGALQYTVKLEFYEPQVTYVNGEISFMQAERSAMDDHTFKNLFHIVIDGSLYTYVDLPDYEEHSRKLSELMEASTHLIISGGSSDISDVKYIKVLPDKLKTLIITTDQIVVGDEYTDGKSVRYYPDFVSFD